MRRMIALLGMLLAVGALTGPARAQVDATRRAPYPQGTRDKASPSIMARYDLDHDGVLSAAEKAALRRDIAEKVEPIRKSMLQQYDWNKNGRLDDDERAAMREARRVQHARSEARALRYFDSNHDGVLDPGEQAARRERREVWLGQKRAQALQTFDADGNGLLDPGEKAAMRQRVAEGRGRALEMFDENGDGRLDAAERALATEAEITERTNRLGRGAGSLSAASGGEARLEGGAARLSIPAGALAADSRVAITPGIATDKAQVGDRRVLAVYQLHWSGPALKKPAALELSYSAVATSVAEADLVVGRWTGEAWQDVGGVAAPATRRITAPVTLPGRYALLARVSEPAGAAKLSDLRFTSPGRASAGVGIAFALGAPGVVSVKIFDTAGRLVRTVARAQSLPAGQQLVRWDGRASDGRSVSNGLYIVRVESAVNSMTRKLSLIR